MNSAETTPLLPNGDQTNRRASYRAHWDAEADVFSTSHVSVDEAALANSTVGERLPYNAYTTIDWMHELVGVSTSLQILADDLRSKIHIATVDFTANQALGIGSYQASTLRPAGLLRPS